MKEYQIRGNKSNYQTLLFGNTATAESTYNYYFKFDPNSHRNSDSYHGRYQFNKHKYGNIIGTFDTEEELECTKAIDQCSEVNY